MATKNPAIGTCPCPIAKCGEQCSVRKFQTRHQRDSARRWAGKLYMDCPKHGRFGIDAKDDMQDWILKNANIPRQQVAPEPESPAAQAASPVTPGDAVQPVATPATPPAAKKGGFGFFP